jgi:hypothetical protein
LTSQRNTKTNIMYVTRRYYKVLTILALKKSLGTIKRANKSLKQLISTYLMPVDAKVTKSQGSAM